MTPDEFRAQGHALVDWLADYLGSLEDRSVLHATAPGDVLAALPEAPPDAGQPWSDILADLDGVITPGLSHWQHPGWFGYFPSNASGPSVLADLVSSGLGVQGMMWATSPAATELEMRMMDWLVDLLGLPRHWRMDTGPGGGVIQSTASDATHIALVAARHRAVEAGHDLGSLVVYASREAHSSVAKGARIAGFRNVRAIDVDVDLALDPAALQRSLDADLADGLVPCAVVSAIGTTSTGAVDPLPAVNALSETHGLWHHVDAAWAGSAMVLPEHRGLQPGLECVDSYVFNPHKWLMVGFDCSAFWMADRGPLLGAMRASAPYLKNAATESGEVVDYRDWHLPLGRRFRSLKLWFVLRHYGRDGLQDIIGNHIEWAGRFAQRVDAHDALERVAPVSLSLVCFRHTAGCDATRAIADAVNASGHSMVTTSVLPDGRAFVRVAVGQVNTAWRHVQRLWDVVDETATRQPAG